MVGSLVGGALGVLGVTVWPQLVSYSKLVAGLPPEERERWDELPARTRREVRERVRRGQPVDDAALAGFAVELARNQPGRFISFLYLAGAVAAAALGCLNAATGHWERVAAAVFFVVACAVMAAWIPRERLRKEQAEAANLAVLARSTE
jgi:hypothetical protein